MSNYKYLFIYLYLLLFARADESTEIEIITAKTPHSLALFKAVENDCNPCFGLVTPILQQERQNHYKDLQRKIEGLNEGVQQKDQQLSDLQIKLAVCEGAGSTRENLTKEQLNRTEIQLKGLQEEMQKKEETIKDLETQLGQAQNRLGICTETVKNKDVQYAQLRDLNISCKNNSKIKDDLIATNRVLINKHIYSTQGEQIKLELKDRRIAELLAAVEKKDANEQKHLETITAQEQKIKDLTEQLNQSKSCLGKSSDVHVIRVPGSKEPFSVYCDSLVGGPGWTVVLRRFDGSINFNRNWTAYNKGFGDLRGEFFIGLEKMHLMTSSQPHELYIYLRDFENNNRYAHYESFRVANQQETYRLSSLGRYSGTAGDALSSQRMMFFSTPDRDNDESPNNCASQFESGWWFRNCYYCNLNGLYLQKRMKNSYGINWFAWHKNPLKVVQMMIRPKQ